MEQPTRERETGSHREWRDLLKGGIAGILALATALSVGDLVAARTGPAGSPIIAVGGAFIDLTPEWLKSFAIATFGESDKLALLGGIGATLVAVAVFIGIVAIRHLALGVAGVLGVGTVGVVAALSRPGADPSQLLPVLIGTASGVVVLVVLARSTRRPPAVDSVLEPINPALDKDASRRSFLAGSAVTLVVVVGAAVVARFVQPQGSNAVAAFPPPASPADAIPSGADLALDELSSYVTPTDAFYRVDTALVVPTVDASAWRLRVGGMVDRPIELSYDDLLDRPLVERIVTLTCVSNQVGGKYVGTARWLGVPLADLLDEAGVHPDSDQLVSRSVDGMSIGTPVAAVFDGRDALIAVGMNGEPLPPVHGYPARMLVPGLYGYVSATKWVTELELTTFDAYDPYWVQRGWSKEAPIKTMSRIDTPRPLSTRPAGRIAVAGVAWAQQRGIATVEVRIDGGPWKTARLADVVSVDTWRQWTFDWNAAPGRHLIEARATDADGETQPGERVEPFPNGATGWHSVVMTVA
jgi:DMSO/TMAO reductase YedYZ molybdopterin-dependent catalytic subunit